MGPAEWSTAAHAPGGLISLTVPAFDFDTYARPTLTAVRVVIGPREAPATLPRWEALRAWIASLPEIPALPLAAIDRDTVY